MVTAHSNTNLSYIESMGLPDLLFIKFNVNCASHYYKQTWTWNSIYSKLRENTQCPIKNAPQVFPFQKACYCSIFFQEVLAYKDGFLCTFSIPWIMKLYNLILFAKIWHLSFTLQISTKALEGCHVVLFFCFFKEIRKIFCLFFSFREEVMPYIFFSLFHYFILLLLLLLLICYNLKFSKFSFIQIHYTTSSLYNITAQIKSENCGS